MFNLKKFLKNDGVDQNMDFYIKLKYYLTEICDRKVKLEFKDSLFSEIGFV